MTKLVQKAFMKGRRTFTLPGDGTVQCDYRHGRRLYEFKVELSRLDENPRQDRFFATSMLVGAIILAVPSLGAIAGVLLSDASSDARFMFTILSVLISPFMLMCIMGIFKQSYRLLVFTNPGSSRDSVVLFQDKPDAMQFEGFVSALRSAIAAAHTDVPKIGTSIAAEVRELMKLREEGVVSEEEFERAKARVINGDANKPSHHTA